MSFKILAAAALALASLTAPAAAQETIVLYRAFIGAPDLQNSQGKKLTEAWQVLRQDRANYHRFGIRQPGDEADPLFADANQRAAMEKLLTGRAIDPATSKAILAGNALVEVHIYGRPAKASVTLVR